MSENTSGMGVRRGHFCRYPHIVEMDGGGAFLSHANQTCGMYGIGIYFTLHTQVSNIGIAYIGEGGNKVTIYQAYIQRMAIAIESSAIDGSFTGSSRTGDRDVGFKAGINPIFVLSSCHHCDKCVPVVVVPDREYSILAGCMAVGDCHCTSTILTCPCMAFIVLGADVVGGKEAVCNGCRTLFVNPADETTITIAITTLKAAVESTVGDGNGRIGYASNKAGKRSFAIHGTFQGDR